MIYNVTAGAARLAALQQLRDKGNHIRLVKDKNNEMSLEGKEKSLALV